MYVDLKEYAKLMAALSDPTRLRLLALLIGQRVCVCHLQEVLGTYQAKVSRHLKVLWEAGLVQPDREGRWIYYRIAPLPVGKQKIVVEFLAAIMCTREVQQDLSKLKKIREAAKQMG